MYCTIFHTAMVKPAILGLILSFLSIGSVLSAYDYFFSICVDAPSVYAKNGTAF